MTREVLSKTFKSGEQIMEVRTQQSVSGGNQGQLLQL